MGTARHIPFRTRARTLDAAPYRQTTRNGGTRGTRSQIQKSTQWDYVRSTQHPPRRYNSTARPAKGAPAAPREDGGAPRARRLPIGIANPKEINGGRFYSAGAAPLILRSIANRTSMRSTASIAIGALLMRARSKNLRRPCAQQDASTIGPGRREASDRK